MKNFLTKKCLFCDFCAPNNAVLDLHSKNFHANSIQSQENIEDERQLTFQHCVCGKTFDDQYSLEVHHASCHISKDNISKENNISNSRIAIGKQNKDYECMFCQKVFTQSGSLSMHIKNVHEERKDFKCDLCNKQFSPIHRCTKLTEIMKIRKLKKLTKY